jgi:AmmeMemoRadiSam system protein A
MPVEHALSAEDRQELLEIAREAIVTHIRSGSVLPREVTRPNLLAERGCFVCVKMNGALRGCIGNFIADKPLYQLVQEMAVAAAVRDPRFYPMKTADLDSFALEISVLSPLRKVDSVEEIEVGTHGIYLEKNFSRGVLLPQVAMEYGWDRETFLAHTCAKAGLGRDDWQEGADIYVFSAQVLNEA